jgi:formate dehydrogenase subunit gamma
VTATTARVLRFGATERAVHWSFTLLFLVLVGTGAALWLPPVAEAVGHRTAFRLVHLAAGCSLLPLPLLIALVGDRRAVAATARELEVFDGDDAAFLRRRPSEPARFNGGQKLNAVWTLTSAVLLTASGVVQWRWPWFPAPWRTGASRLHDLLAVAAVVVVAGHVHLSVLHRSTRHSLRGITSGRVRSDWAAEHHPRWLRDG